MKPVWAGRIMPPVGLPGGCRNLRRSSPRRPAPSAPAEGEGSAAGSAGAIIARLPPRLAGREFTTALQNDSPPLNPHRAPIDPRERRWLRALLVCVSLLHLPGLLNPFFIDDYVYLETVKNLTAAKVADIFTSSTMGEEASGVWWTPAGALPFYRPLGEMTFALDWAIWGLRPAGYHLTNLLLHTLCVYLVWRLARRLFGPGGVPIGVALVFGLHPVHHEAVAWISGRFDLLVCATVTASTLAYLRWREGGPRSGRWLALSLVGFVAGLGCKETGLILPAMIVAIELFLARGSVRPLGHRLGALVAFGGLSLLYLYGRFQLFDGLGHLPPPYGLDRSTTMTAVRSLAWNLAQYTLDLALFIQVDAIYLADFWSRNLGVMLAVLAMALAVFAVTARLAWRHPGWRLGLVWLAIFTAPSLLAMPGERNVYLASAGIAMMAGGVLWALNRRSTLGGRPSLALRRCAVALVGFWVVLGFVEQGVMWCLASAGERVFRDLETMLPDPPRDARIFVVNQCPLNAVGFDQAIRLRYDREDLGGCALSLSPNLEGGTRDVVVQTGPDTVRLQREGAPLFASFIERFHLFSEPATSLPAAARRMGLEILDPPATYADLTSLEFRLPMPVADPRIQLFVWDNSQVRGRADYPFLMTLASLRRETPQEPARLSSAAAGKDGASP